MLFEDEQVLPDGRSRRRNVAVSEKMVCGEPWLAALHRAVKEELSSALPPNYQVGARVLRLRCRAVRWELGADLTGTWAMLGSSSPRFRHRQARPTRPAPVFPVAALQPNQVLGLHPARLEVLFAHVATVLHASGLHGMCCEWKGAYRG